MKGVAGIALLACLSLAGCSPGERDDTPVAEIPAAGIPADQDPVLTRSLARDPGPGDEVALVETSLGSFVLRLFPTAAPIAVSNFKGLAVRGYYDGLVFHRVIDGFMIQGGDPTATGRGGTSLWGGRFEDEILGSLRFDRAGLLGMANSGPGTNRSQFFVTVSPRPNLNGRHTIFGEVMVGMDVVRSISRVETDEEDRPVEPVTIRSIRIETR